MPDERRAGPDRREAVNHPAHYGGEDNPYEAIKVIEAWGLGFHDGNAAKYICRQGKKSDRIEDLKKALWYLDRLIAKLEMEKQEQGCRSGISKCVICHLPIREPYCIQRWLDLINACDRDTVGEVRHVFVQESAMSGLFYPGLKRPFRYCAMPAGSEVTPVRNTKPRIVRGLDGSWVLFFVESTQNGAARRELARSCPTWATACAVLRWFYVRGLVLRDNG